MTTTERVHVSLIVSDHMEWTGKRKIRFEPLCTIVPYTNADAWGTLRMVNQRLQLYISAIKGLSSSSPDIPDRQALLDYLKLYLAHPKVNSLALICDQEGAQAVESICRELGHDSVVIHFGGKIVIA